MGKKSFLIQMFDYNCGVQTTIAHIERTKK